MAGVVALLAVEMEVFPRFSPQRISITAFYPGADPTEIEQRVCIPIEEAIHNLPGVARLDTKASQNWRLEDACVIDVQVKEGRDPELLMGALRSRIQSIRHLPVGIDHIDVEESYAKGDDGSIWVALYGPTDTLTLKRLGTRIQADLARLPGVDKALNYGEVPYELAIEVPSARLLQYGLTLSDVANAVRRTSLDLPVGLLKTPDGNMQLSVKGLAREASAVGERVVLTRPDGSRVRIKDIAIVRDGLEERDFAWHHDGFPAQGWQVYTKQDEVEVARRVKAYVAKMAQRLPEGIRLIAWHDDSQSFDERVNTLVKNGLMGFGLLFLVLAVFVSVRLALWASLGLLTAIFGALTCMWWIGISLNMLTMFGFILALGILVDDAIIVGESIHRFEAQGMLHGKRSGEAALQGVEAVAAPVILAVLTTIIAFLPGLFLEGWADALLGPICVVVILALLFSLVEALLILPVHLVTPPRAANLPPTRWRRMIDQGLDRIIMHLYLPLLAASLRQPHLTLSVFVSGIIITAALVYGGQVRLAIQADVPKDTITLFLDVPTGTPYAQTRALAVQVERAYATLRADLQSRQPKGAPSPISGVESMTFEHWAGFWIELAPGARQHFRVEDLAREWRELIGDIGIGKLDFIYREGDTYYDLEWIVSASDPKALTAGVQALQARLADYPGLFDINNTQSAGKKELHLSLRPVADRYGMGLEEVAHQARHAWQGKEVHRFNRGREQVKVVVRLPPEERRMPAVLEQMPVMLSSGAQVPLGTLAEWQKVAGPTDIARRDRQRVVWVRARLDPQRADANAIYAEMDKVFIDQLSRKLPGVRIEVGQARQTQQAALILLGRNTLLALVVIYALLAIFSRSYLQPVIFVFAVPVAWAGSVLGHYALGLPLSMESLVGMIAAGGVVVNDSLVLFHTIRNLEVDSKSSTTYDLIREACCIRFRPIMLAFLTTFAGLLPLLLETSAQAQFLLPMAVSLAVGLLFGMSATLVLVPVAVLILKSGDMPASVNAAA